MNIFVCIKAQVRGRDVVYAEDTGQPVRPVRLDVGTTDEVALQAALDLRNLKGGTVTVVSAADERADACLQHCLERGADRALRIECPQVPGEMDTTTAARFTAETIRSERADIIFCASRSGDLGSGFFPFVLARAASCCLVTRVIDIDWASDKVTVVRKLERGWRERYNIEPPTVIAVEDELVRPRHVAVLGRTHRQGLMMAVECRTAHIPDGNDESGASLHEVAQTLPQPRRRPVARIKPGGSSRDRLRRKRPIADKAGGKAQPVILDGNPQVIGKELVDTIQGWLAKAKDKS